MNRLKRPSAESGFTLVEALVAIVVLAFGLIAVTNLSVVAASSNSVANQSTAAAVAASDRLEILRNQPFATLAANVGNGDILNDVGATGLCRATAALASYNCDEQLLGVGVIHTRWQIRTVPGTARMVRIEVRSEGTGVLARARSRAEFMTLKSCTDSTSAGLQGATACPLPP